MLEEIIKDDVTWTAAANQPLFRSDIDYESLVVKRNAVLAEWRGLDAAARAPFPTQRDFEASRGILSLKDPDLIPSRNLWLLMREARERINSTDDLRLL